MSTDHFSTPYPLGGRQTELASFTKAPTCGFPAVRGWLRNICSMSCGSFIICSIALCTAGFWEGWEEGSEGGGGGGRGGKGGGG